MLEGTHSGGESGSQPESGAAESVAQTPDSPPQPSVSTEDEADEGTGNLPLDVTFEILKNRRRRLVLEYIRNSEETITIGELAEHIAAIENDITVQQLNAQQRKRVYIGLYQCHLPKMDDAGVVEFNQDRGLIDPGENVDPVYEYLEVDDQEPQRTDVTRIHLGAYVLFGVVFSAAVLSNAQTLANGVVVAFLAGVLALTYWTNYER